MCAGKRRFRTEVEAMLHMATWPHGHRQATEVVRCYRCPICKGWHLTSKPLRPRKAS